jgi:GT2 family glycosyltransferase
MKFSILIVSYQRHEALCQTLHWLDQNIDSTITEVLVMLDGYGESLQIYRDLYPNIIWFSSKEHLGASRCRNILYKKAKGIYLIGLDDDANPIQENFLDKVELLFSQNKSLAIISFYEFKNISLPQELNIPDIHYFTNDFIGCGFAIRKDIYEKTDGFPLWIDIYGEELCVASEVLDMGYNILFTSAICVHHRVDKELRKNMGYNLFRFQKSLINQTLYFLVYYPLLEIPYKLIRLYVHNLNKYGSKNFTYFFTIIKSLLIVFLRLPIVIKYRKPISLPTLKLIRKLPNPRY